MEQVSAGTLRLGGYIRCEDRQACAPGRVVEENWPPAWACHTNSIPNPAPDAKLEQRVTVVVSRMTSHSAPCTQECQRRTHI